MKIYISKIITLIILAGFANVLFAESQNEINVGIFGKLNTLNEKIDSNSAGIKKNAVDINSNAININQNINILSSHEDRIDALETAPPPASDKVYDYHDYGAPNVISRTYDWYDTKQNTCTREKHDIRRENNDDGTKSIFTTRTRYNKDTEFICQIREMGHLATANDYQYLGYNDRNRDTGVITGTLLFKSPFITRTSQMKIGHSWSHGSGATYTSQPAAFHVIRTTTFVGVEDVKVPAGTFTGCLKSHTRILTLWGYPRDIVKWRCADVGLVKSIVVFNDGSRSHRIKLISVTTSP